MINALSYNNLRMSIAQKMFEEHFAKWTTTEQAQSIITQLINQIKTGQYNPIAQPDPTFVHKLASTMPLQQMRTPLTPPKSPSMDKSYKLIPSSPIRAAPTLEKSIKKEAPQGPVIPRFYFPDNKAIDSESQAKLMTIINDEFKKETEMDESALENVIKSVCGFSRYLVKYAFDKIDKKNGKVSMSAFVEYFNNEIVKFDLKKRFFRLIAKPNKSVIVPDDFKKLLKYIIDKHPGLQFFKPSTEFHEKYISTVIERIFYEVDANDDRQITYREFKKSKLMETIMMLDDETDINKIRRYFSYEHYYVIYCRFWELDADHDYLIKKEDFARYEGYALSNKTIDRIFSQIPRKFISGSLMNYEDFVWFMLSEEDKTTIRSVNYWFKVLDLDENGVVGPYEMQYFYEEQIQRIECYNHEPILFNDILCQMNDMICPQKEGNYTIEDLKKLPSLVGLFFNSLFNLNKLICFEQRDMYAEKHEIAEFPDYSDWDRFAKSEYARLDENAENMVDQ